MKKSERFKIIVADDHPVYREGMESLLSKVPEIEKIALVENGEKVVELLEQESYNLIFMDIDMPVMDGIEATKIIKKRFPRVKVIAMSLHSSWFYIEHFYNLGAEGYVTKGASSKEISKALSLVKEGLQYYSPEALITFYKIAAERQKDRKYRKKMNDGMSPRLREVLNLICEQYSSEEIGSKLGISLRTVKRHKQILMQKSGARNLAGLVTFAIRKGVYEILIEEPILKQEGLQ